MAGRPIFRAARLSGGTYIFPKLTNLTPPPNRRSPSLQIGNNIIITNFREIDFTFSTSILVGFDLYPGHSVPPTPVRKTRRAPDAMRLALFRALALRASDTRASATAYPGFIPGTAIVRFGHPGRVHGADARPNARKGTNRGDDDERKHTLVSSYSSIYTIPVCSVTVPGAD